ncbi:DUF2793 domain-containing protein [Antarcticirhabdus aurantiaca]|uniref:DUF2793 domain-containing protein n=1 Tax=Antarcticirhabdus aurantiaca TaxID=2606717 RepID=A0ACD4NJL0_9HYPH|nr:DUF2793 domain-containing protein [Antarcticirhabdus aurantiaca]WAJ27040.1 DUF2793 domain-containing protein [Jeongeuplla avenae]
MDTTAHLKLPLIMPAQAQKHLTHNEAIEAIDALVQLAVSDAAASAPPAAPTEGARVIVAPGATGSFAGQDGALAAFQAGAWRFHAPKAGWIAFVASENRFLAHDGAGWVPLAASVLKGIERLGIGADADITNRFAVKSAAALFDHRGAGHQMKINKAAAGDTASLVFQTGYSGRAEMGLSGDESFRIKTSADGASWREALRVDAATGETVIGACRVSREMQMNLLPDSGRFNGNANNAAVANITYGAPTYLSAPAGGSLAGHAKFVADSADYGGAGPALNADVKALVDTIRAPAARRFGPEWFVLRVSLGATLAEPVAIAGENFGLAVRLAAAALPGRYTAAYHLKVLSGRAAIAADAPTAQRTAIDGAPVPRQPALLQPSDGWRHVAIEGLPGATGTDERALQLLGTAGAQILLALPKLIAGHVDLPPTLGLLMNPRLFG